MSKVIGLTGGIASGKSSVSGWFKNKGVPVVDADIGARKVVEKGRPVLEEIKNLFGTTILLENGELNRIQLGKIIFNDSQKREQLNQLIHPHIRKWILDNRDQYLTENPPLIILDIPLLFEANYAKEVDEVMVVYVDEDRQLERLMERDGINKFEATKRMNSQMNLLEKKNKANIVIDNNQSLSHTFQQLEKWYETV